MFGPQPETAIEAINKAIARVIARIVILFQILTPHMEGRFLIFTAAKTIGLYSHSPKSAKSGKVIRHMRPAFITFYLARFGELRIHYKCAAMH